MTPVNDEWTEPMHKAFIKGKRGAVQIHGDKVDFRIGDGWMGWHQDERNMMSDSHDYLLENGLVTNSLCIYYLQHYRSVIPYQDWIKLHELKYFYEKVVGQPGLEPGIQL